MGKCEFLIIKGVKKGKTCDMYTTKNLNKKFYCNSHFKIVSKNEPKIEEPKMENSDKVFEVEFNSNDDLDTMIHKSFQKTKGTVKVEDNNSIQKCLHQVLDKLDIIENMIHVKKYEYNSIDDIPDVEEFKL
jgi:hypothetical protein